MPKSKKFKKAQPPLSPTTKVPPKERWNGRALLAGALLIIVLSLGTYAYSMTGNFVFNDTLNYATMGGVEDRATHWAKLLLSAMDQPLSLPWLRATYAWDVSSFGYSPGWAHAVNILLHACSVLYFYLFAFRLGWHLKQDGRTKIEPYAFALAAACLLAVHPLVSGSIAYISGREGVLGATNYFLALNCFLVGFLEDGLAVSMLGYLGFFAFTAVGILTNLQCLTLPLVAVVLTFILKPSAVKLKDYLSERVFEISLLGIVGVVFCYLIRFGFSSQIDSSMGLPTVSATIYHATQFKMLLLYYLRCALIPFGMAVYPPFVSTGWFDPGTIGGIFALIAISAAGFIQKNPLIRAGTTIFFFGLFPWLVMRTGELSADARFYLPISGLCIAAGVAAAYLSELDLGKTTKAFGLILLLLASLSVYRETQWFSDLNLWRAEAKVAPDNARVHAYLASGLLENNNLEQSQNEVAIALKLNPNDFIAHLCRAFIFLKQSNNKDALPELIRAVELGEKIGLSEDQMAGYRTQLARSFYLADNMPEAVKQATLASRFITTDPVLNLILGKNFLAEGKPLQALKVLEDGWKLNRTNAEFLIPIAQASLDSGMPQVVQHGYAAAKRAIQVRPSPTATKLFIRACLAFGQPGEGLGLLKNARKTDPDDMEFVWLESGYEQAAGHKDVAAKLAKTALDKDPTLAKRMKLFMKKSDSSDIVPAMVLPSAATTK